MTARSSTSLLIGLSIGIEQSIHDDVAAAKKWLDGFAFLPRDTPVGGYVFDIKTGLLKELVAPKFKQ